ncbi:nmra-like family [Trichoderma arundinaceum]|uniref:Nmra-like family n=1 Tax=Trichoderma arundinaceum TaxID=490622 RepID=A0A395NPX6_TRIAR|nr:nmra-like family [Trichoderma arundinaceum]
MSVVAVAGGSGNVGRTIVETLAETSKYKVIVLGRKSQQILKNIPTYAVDYTDADATAKILEQHEVQIVISAIQVTDGISSAAEVNLIKASEQSSTVSRFIASGWGSLPNETSPTSSLQKASESALRKTMLEWTRFSVGFFLDYYGIPTIKTHLPPMSFAVDMNSKKAAIPGTGNEPIAFIYSYDVAKFVAAYLDAPKWEEVTYVYGEKTTWNSFIKVASEVTGSVFEVTYDPAEKLAKGEVTELPSHKEELANSPFPEALARQILALLGSWVVGGQFDIPVDKALNKRFPLIKPMGIRDVLLARQNS